MKQFFLLLIILITTQYLIGQPNIKYGIQLSDKKCYIPKSKNIFISILTHSSGSNYYLSVDDPGSQSNVVLGKFNSSMDTIWTRTLGGSEEDRMEHIFELPNGNILLAGETSSNDGDVWYGHTYSAKEIWVVEVDTLGNLIKGRTFGGSNGSDLLDAIVSSDGMIYLCGSTIANDYDFTHFSFGWLDSDGWMAKLDTAFNLDWVNVMSGNNDEGIVGFREINPTRLFFSLPTYSTDTNMLGSQSKGSGDVLAGFIDSAGNIIWKKRYGSTVGDGGFALVTDTARGHGYFINFNGAIDADITYATDSGNIWVLKLDTIGNILGSKAYGPLDNDWLFKDARFYNNHVWVCADTYSDGGDVDSNTTGLSNAWIGMIDSNVNLVGKYTINGNMADFVGYFFSLNSSQYLYAATTGYSPNTEGCTPDDTITNYLVKLNTYPVGIVNTETPALQLFTLIPNPSSNMVKVSISEKQHWNLTVTNAMGQIILEEKQVRRSTNSELDISYWPNGMYYFNIKQENKTETKPFLKQ